MQKIVMAGLALAGAMAAGAGTASAQAARADTGVSLAAQPQAMITHIQYRGRWHGRYRHWRGGGWHHGGAAVGAGIAGLAAGAIIGGAIANSQAQGYYAPPAGDAVNYCMQRFRSYDPASGTYLGYDGLRHPCP
jgi:hypothetical protein